MFYLKFLHLTPFRTFRYRDRVAIISDILRAVKMKREARKTQIMEMARLNYIQTKKYLNYLVGCGYLAVTERQTYVITEKGARFLNLVEIQKIQIVR